MKNNKEILYQNDLLLDAVKLNNIEKAKAAIINGADINLKDDKEAPLLMWAAYKTNLDFVKFLIQMGADCTTKGLIDDGKKGFYGNLNSIAAGEEKMKLLKYFIEELNIDVDDDEQSIDNKPGWTALQWAVSKNNPKIIKYLIKKGANPNPIYLNLTILHRVIRHQNVKVFDLLLKAGSSIINNNVNITLLADACRLDNDYFVDKLIDLGADLNELSSGAPALLYAVGHGKLDRCKMLISKGANPHQKDLRGNTALSIAQHLKLNKLDKYLKKI